MEQGWDPEVKKYFKKILNTIGMGLLWMMLAVMVGLYWGWAYAANKTYVLIFYSALAISFFFLIRYFYKTWKK